MNAWGRLIESEIWRLKNEFFLKIRATPRTFLKTVPGSPRLRSDREEQFQVCTSDRRPVNWMKCHVNRSLWQLGKAAVGGDKALTCTTRGWSVNPQQLSIELFCPTFCTYQEERSHLVQQGLGQFLQKRIWSVTQQLNARTLFSTNQGQ